MPLEVHLHSLLREPAHLRGELSADELGLDLRDDLIRAPWPLTYAVEAQLMGEALLARGRLELALGCTCCRCLKEFVHCVVLTDWAVLVPFGGEDGVPPGSEVVDLTPQVREDILLAFPQHPVCEPGCQGLVTRPGVNFPEPGGQGPTDGGGASSVWSDLDRLKF